MEEEAREVQNKVGTQPAVADSEDERDLERANTHSL